MNKILVLKLLSLSHTPPAKYSTELLREAGFSVTLLEYGFGEWVQYFPRPLRSGLHFFAAALQAFHLTFKIKPQWIITHGINEQVIGWFLSVCFKVPLICHVHEVYERSQLSRFNRLLVQMEGVSLRRAVLNLFPGIERAQIYRERYHLLNPTQLVFNCPRLLKQEGFHREVWKKWGIPENKKIIFYVGGIGPNMALQPMIEALPFLTDYCFVMAGFGEPSYISQLPKHERCFWIGKLEGEKKWELLRNADVGYCVYYSSELRLKYGATASNKLWESIACGLPIVTGPQEDFKRLVGTLKVGEVAGSYEPQAIAQAILKIIKVDKMKLLQLHSEQFHYEKQYEPVLYFLGKRAAELALP